MTGRFAAGSDLMSVAQALSLLEARLSPAVGTEETGLHHALGRILAEDLVSGVNVPPHDNSAVDGWAFRRADLPADGILPVVGRVAAGHPLEGPLPQGGAVRIFTGAPMPTGADTVAMQEDCKDLGGSVALPAKLAEGDNARAAGEDISKGSVVLHAGTRLRPQELGVAAATGRSSLKVFRPLRAAVFSTGDEIRNPGTELPPGCIFDTNRFTATGLLRALGAEVTDLGILPDRFEVIRDALAEAAASHQLILTSGGVSVGDEDHVKPAVLAQGSLDFWRLAIKPGRPVALGEVKGTPFVGLPGNPVAVMVTFMAIARPMVLRLMGAAQTDLPRYPVEAGFAFRHKPGRREYLRARLAHMDGRLVAAKFPSDGSGVLTSMTWSDGLVDIPEDRGDIAPGEMVEFLSYADMMR
ncbi:Molybdopterin biosynthesis protein MoeA [Paramagnetospirillum magnetotacticum MS-1]|uniref:Molybdopterin molybdenumtransferase n=1 Tax=Paramagnetospirillum magnetotacticum MS-1 TaxID=272627 RepID=A0A0C2YBS9_PARME|nr:gephyrin-like molybdotransferase Glp [Paramagnetospirillum magnetotacticum]KIL97184.1 Molybdopterin biosynthesis protein MoeA [Paramagnetospirillum magnetotacticum MS-1]